jgi:tripartite-type tricarboxylate transporter receptor subunit TctC
MRRKTCLYFAAASVALALASSAAAQTYPLRPVHILVGFPGGSASDTTARLIGQFLSERLGQQFVVENRTGAASNLAAEAVAHAPPDGYTLLLVTSVNAINAKLYHNLGFDLIHDIVPVARLVRGPGIMEVNPVFPAKTVPEFIAYAKANPGKINMGTAGSGSMLDVFGQMFKMMAGVDMVAVPYRGAPPAITDLLGGRVQVVFDTFAASIEFVRAGKLRPLAVTTATRSPILPDVPPLAEFLPPYDASAEQHATRDRREAQRRDQHRSRRSDHAGAHRKFRLRRPSRLARRVRQVHRRRNRKMGRGGPGGEHETGLRAFVIAGL